MPEFIQRAIALLLMIPSLPVIVMLAILIRLDSPGGPFHLAVRVGEGGRPFRVIKLRTMRRGAATEGPGLSVRDDTRITRVGRLLRDRRLDELPQLWNVLCGEMLLVGPRPEDPRFVNLTDPIHRRVFTAKPGITGLTQLEFASEAAMLDPFDPERTYRERVLPAKLALDQRYLASRSTRLDLWILLQTLRTAFGHRLSPEEIASRLAGN